MLHAHDSPSTPAEQTKPGNSFLPEVKRALLVLPYVALYLWFRFEPYSHLHPLLIAVWTVVFFAMTLVFAKCLSGRSRIILIAVWALIGCLVATDFVQRYFYEGYSAEHFLAQARENSEQVKKRAVVLVKGLEAESAELEHALSVLDTSKIENIPIGLSERAGQTKYWWGVYNDEGRLLAWNGQVRSYETYISEGSREVDVEGLLHQQFLKLKRSVKVSGVLYMLSAYEPIAADYGIENQYLSSFNRLTDELPIRPVLLYNSESSARSPDVVVQNVTVSPEFSISALYEKTRYQEFMEGHIHRLHWWLELLAISLFVFTSVFLMFEFIGISGQQRPPGELLITWTAFLGITILAALSVAQFSSFATRSFFSSRNFELDGFWGLFHSPGCYFFTAFFFLNLTFSFAFLNRGTKAGLSWKFPALNYLLIAAALAATWPILASYQGFMRTVMSLSPYNLITFSMLGMTATRVALILGDLWLDLCVVFMIAIAYAFLIRGMPRTGSRLLLLMALTVLSGSLFSSLFYANPAPSIPVLLLCCGLNALIYFFPRLWPWFEGINPLSRMFALLILVSLIGSLFYAMRFRYAMELREEFIRQDAAQQVIGQQAAVQEMLRQSTEQLDDALQTLTLDPRIPDLPYRLWLRTRFAKSGVRSAVELYDDSGMHLNGFSLRLPSLHNLNITGMATDTRWRFQPIDVMFSTQRRLVYTAVRRLDNGGYIAMQTMEDAENLPFMPSTSPMQEAFRAEHPAGRYVESLSLSLYDSSWRPFFVSDPDLAPSVEAARSLLRERPDGWLDGLAGNRPVRAYFFRFKRGAAALVVPSVALRTHIVQLIDLFLLNLLWIGTFNFILYAFFRRHLSLHFRAETPIRFSFYQKLLFAFLVFSMVPMLFLSYIIRNYVWEKKTTEVTSRALYSFSVASRVISDYLFSQGNVTGVEIFHDDTMEWIGQVAQQDVSVYFEGMLIGTSIRDFYTAGLLGPRLQGAAHVDLFLEGRKFSIGESQIGKLNYLNVSGRVQRGRFKDEVVAIPFLIDRRGVEDEIIGLREYMMLVGGGLILFAVLIGWFLAGRFVRPVQVLIEGATEMSRGNLRYRIPQQYRDEFQQLVGAFNTMANSLDEQQEALERRRQYIENILDHITTAVISIDRTMHIATVNPAAAEMLGVDASGRLPLEEAVSQPGTWPELGGAFRQFLASPRELQMREVAEYRTNRELHFRLVYVPLFQEQEWAGAVLLVEDISDIIQSNRLAAFAEMARRVAHEVKNPLTPIQLAMEHLVRVYEDRGGDFESVLKSCSDAVLKQVKALRRLVSDFSQYGRPAVLNRVETDIGTFLEDVAKSYEAHLPTGIRMQTEIDPQLPRIRIDVEKIRGAVMNILENGLQAMNGAGAITIQAGMQDRMLRIAVRDNGAGIPAEILPRLFEPYFSTKSGGTGLGLAIARKNVEDHGGAISVESAPGTGTTVVIRLPVS